MKEAYKWIDGSEGANQHFELDGFQQRSTRGRRGSPVCIVEVHRFAVKKVNVARVAGRFSILVSMLTRLKLPIRLFINISGGVLAAEIIDRLENGSRWE
jgi:hypothetical protein